MTERYQRVEERQEELDELEADEQELGDAETDDEGGAEERTTTAAGQPARGGTREKGPSRQTLQREERRRRSARRRARKRLLYGLGGGTIAAVLILSLFLPSLIDAAGGNTVGSDSPTARGNLPSVGTQVPIQEAGIVGPGEEHPDYASTPPTSGPRYEEGVEPGVYEEPQPNEALVRNLEQGAIVVHHNLTDQAQIDDLESFITSQAEHPGCYVVQPNEGIAEGSITLTAWGWMQTFDSIDRTAMEEFINDHVNSGAPLYLSPTCGYQAPADAE